jgi:hypothetical protein
MVIAIRFGTSARRQKIRAVMAVCPRRMKAPGHVRPFTLLEGCLDEPLLLTGHEQGRAPFVECAGC